MSVSRKDTTVVLVQGCFQTPLVYEALCDKIEQNHYECVFPTLPTCTNPDDPAFTTKDLDDDTTVVRNVIKDLVVAKHQKVMVVMHSYGGLVGSNAVDEELAFSRRQAKNLPGGVTRLFYFSAFILGKGQSVSGTFGEDPNTEIKDGKFFYMHGAKILYSDLPEEDAKKWDSRMVPQSSAVRDTKITTTAYDYVPSTYLISQKDPILSVPIQETLAAIAHSEIATIDSGHSPMLSRLEELVAEIVKVLEKD